MPSRRRAPAVTCATGSRGRTRRVAHRGDRRGARRAPGRRVAAAHTQRAVAGAGQCVKPEGVRGSVIHSCKVPHRYSQITVAYNRRLTRQYDTFLVEEASATSMWRV